MMNLRGQEDAMRVKLAVIAAAVAVAVLPLPASLVERWYSGLVYPRVQASATFLSNLFPVALLDVLLIAAAVWIVRRFIAVVVRRRTGLVHALVGFGVWAAALCATLYLVFLATWGLNYRRVPLTEKLPFDSSSISHKAAVDLGCLSVAKLNVLYGAAHAGFAASSSGIDQPLAQAFSDVQGMLGVRKAMPARPKYSVLDVYFRAAAVDAMTDPFFLETLTVSNLLPVERPFVVAHEWSHLAGFADESEANFVGWLTSMHGPPSAQYSGWLFLYGEIVRGLSPADRGPISAGLANGPREDLQAIADRIARGIRPRVSAIGWRVYDRYLKANRVAAGTASYALVVQLILGTKFDAHWRPVGSPALTE
jgi:hypothetical protein